MHWKRFMGLGLALFLGGTVGARAQTTLRTNVVTPPAILQVQAEEPAPGDMSANQATPIGTRPAVESAGGEPQTPALGPTPLDKVNILNDLIFGENAENPLFKISGWMDFDYTYRSSGSGLNNIAPVENRFGNEFLARELGVYLYRPLNEKEWSWGFNCIFLGGSDASFLTPTAGGWRNDDPRFGSEFNDLNVTAHLPILFDGGIDLKAGRQTTVLGPEGALAWQRYFDSSDYAWYNLEEGRYTGVSGVAHISKQLDWYAGIEFGWGTFYDVIGPAPQYITQISYWLDEDAKMAKVWTTVLTGQTGKFVTGNTTVFEAGLLINYNEYLYQIIDTQMLWSRAPLGFVPPPGYNESAYDVYTYAGCHLNAKWDVNSRFEWYYDVNGGGYPGGFGDRGGLANTNYFESTVGLDYHPYKWMQFRPEIRNDWANNPAFGPTNSRKEQLSLAADMLLKF
jgi:hypothetical protein